jgi:hypothetical protein
MNAPRCFTVVIDGLRQGMLWARHTTRDAAEREAQDLRLHGIHARVVEVPAEQRAP